MAVIRNADNKKKERIKISGVISGDIKIFNANVAGEEKELLRAKLSTHEDGEVVYVRVCCWSPSDGFIDILSKSSDDHVSINIYGYWKKSKNPKYDDTFVVDEKMTIEDFSDTKEQADDFVSDEIPF